MHYRLVYVEAYHPAIPVSVGCTCGSSYNHTCLCIVDMIVVGLWSHDIIYTLARTVALFVYN